MAKEITVFLCVLEQSGGWGGVVTTRLRNCHAFLMETKELSTANKWDLPRDLEIKMKIAKTK